MTVELTLPEIRFSWDPEIDGVLESLPPIISQTDIANSVRSHLFNKETEYPEPCPHYKKTAPIDQIKPLDNEPSFPSPEESTHKVMSISDFELTKKAKELEREDLLEREAIQHFLPTTHEAKAATKGVSGHTITALVTDLETQVRNSKKIRELTIHHPGLKPHERAIIEAAASDIITRYPKIEILDVPELVGDIWTKIRDKHVFVKKIPNSTKKALLDGSKFSHEWVQNQWASTEQKTFEERLLIIHNKRIHDISKADLFDSTDLIMALQSMPGVKLAIEKLAISQINFGWYGIQLKGQKDYELKTRVNGLTRYVRIDDKYGKADDLFGEANRMQALSYSSIAEMHKGSRHFTNLQPHGMFLYRVFDIANLDYYYVDASIWPSEYQEVLTNVRHHTLLWWLMHNEFRQIKQIKNQSMIMPHLPEEAELTRASQAAMLLV